MADEPTFLDTLIEVPNDVIRFSNDVADYVDRHIERVAAALRESLSGATWIPESARPKPLPQRPAPPVPIGTYDRVQKWVLAHKILCGTFVVGLGAFIFLVHKRRKARCRKRRAKRASNNARLEVVVIAGSPADPITRSLALDLERRGFIVFVVCNDVEEELMVQNEARSDIRPLTVDVSQPMNSNNSIDRLANYLQTPQHAFDGARHHHLIFNSLILIPSMEYPSTPIAAISPTHISDLLNTRLLHPILITQAFLPLLTSVSISQTRHHVSSHTPAPSPKVLVLTPSIISSISPPFHAPESLIVSALTAFTECLSAELKPLGIAVTNLKLGSFDLSHTRNHLQAQSVQAHRADLLCWPEGTRQVYGKNFLSVLERTPGGVGMRGTPLRELHKAVFDAMERRKGGGVERVGVGSALYGFVGAWAPRGLVAWMMGVGRVNRLGWSTYGSESGSDTGKEEATIGC